MPDQIKTIGSGQDYATITLWEADADVSDGYWQGIIMDNAEFNETVVVAGITGTPTIDNYVWLTVDASVRHSGVAGTGARIRGSTNGTHVFLLSENFCRIEYLEIQQDSSGNSDECIRFDASTNNHLISRCIIWSETTVGDQDGIYAGNWAIENVHIDHCIIYGFARAGIHAQNYNNNVDQSWYIDFCTISDCGSIGESLSAGINSRADPSGSVNTMTVYNTASIANAVGGDDWHVAGGFGIVNWIGSNNADSDGTLTGLMSSGSQQNLTRTAVTQSTGDWFVVNNDTLATLDMTLLDDAAGNKPYANGISRVGSESDVRQDFSFDIVGNLRSTTGPAPDIGASEYTSLSLSLFIQAATHGHIASSVLLTQQNTIVTQDSAHAHAADNIDLVTDNSLTLADALHAHAADNIDLVTDNNLTLADALHNHAADNIDLVQAHSLVMQDSAHAHLAANINLTLQNQLAIASALHGHVADNITIDLANSLAIADAAHGHSAESLALSQANILAIQHALHALSSDDIDLTQSSVLVIDNALHALISDNVTLTLPSVAVTPRRRTYIIQHECRTFIVVA